MDGAAPGRAASGRGVPIELSPTAGRAPRDPRPQGRAQGRPKPVRGAARRPVPRAPARADAESKRFVERLRSTDRRRATGCGHGRQGRARRPYGAPPRYTRRAATAAPLIRSSPGRRVAVVGRLPGKRRERGRFFGRNQGADTIWDAGRHYEEGDGVRA